MFQRQIITFPHLIFQSAIEYLNKGFIAVDKLNYEAKLKEKLRNILLKERDSYSNSLKFC